MADDDSKKAILARRAFFITAALASAGIGAGVVPACGGETDEAHADAEPQPCLKFAPADAEPQPCLDVAIDASVDAESTDAQDADADADADVDAGPRPCLTPQ